MNFSHIKGKKSASNLWFKFGRLHNYHKAVFFFAFLVLGVVTQPACSALQKPKAESQDAKDSKPAPDQPPRTEQSANGGSKTETLITSQPTSMDITPKLVESLDDLLRKVDALDLAGSKVGSHTPTEYANAEEAALEKRFFTSFQSHRYNDIDELLGIYKEYANRNPNSVYALGRLAYLNLWRWNERYTMNEVPINTTKALNDCVTYFDRVLPLGPKQMVNRAFGTSCKLLSGLVAQKLDVLLEANRLAGEAINGLAEFALFSISYSFQVAPIDSKRFQVGTVMLMRLLDVCMGQNIDRNNLDLRPYLGNLVKKQAPYQSYCLNTYMSPHSREGLYLTIGDVLLKAGNMAGAKAMYENIKASPGFGTWPFRGLVEERLKEPEKFQKDFNIMLNGLQKPSHNLMAIAGEYSCSICHMPSSDEAKIILDNFDRVVAERKSISGFLMPGQTP
jgi:hypothetical protein